MVESTRPTPDARLDVLDGLRGLAILIVLWYHVWEWSWLGTEFNAFGKHISFQFAVETGFTGVDLFFFISGFVLFYPYARHIFEGKKLQTVREFAYRRFIKIVPSYYFQLIVLTPWIVAAFVGAHLVFQYVTHALFIQNWFRESFGAINGVWWTLAIEVQFYVAFPLICWSFRRWPLLTFGAMLAIANAYRLLLAPHYLGDYVVMSQMPAFLDLFGCGMLASWLFVLAKNRMPDPASWRLAFTLLGMTGFVVYGVLLYTLFQIRVVLYWQQLWTNSHLTLLGLTFILLTVCSCLAFEWWRKAIANRVLVFLSIISYNLYLWHQLIANFLGRHNIPSVRTDFFYSDRAWQWSFTVVTIVVSIVVSTLITYILERPLLKKGFRAWTELFAKRPAAAPTNGSPAKSAP
jgi:peptidoglycan/LPS O-acetylase OafA/YrhL